VGNLVNSKDINNKEISKFVKRERSTQFLSHANTGVFNTRIREEHLKSLVLLTKNGKDDELLKDVILGVIINNKDTNTLTKGRFIQVN
jgi:hypothetical protein